MRKYAVLCLAFLLMLSPAVAAIPAYAAPLEQLGITAVEPKTLPAETGGTLSVYGSGFTSNTVVRLVGYGLLTTELVNSTALRATVPAGLAAGSYDVQVSDGAATATLSKAVQILAAPTPTPTPQPPVAGRPNLVIRTYSIQPTQVKAGQDFVVTIHIYNNGSRASENTLAIFPGGTFLPVGNGGHQLWQLHINATAIVTQTMHAPASLTSGVQNIQINLSGNDYEGNHYDFPHTLSVEVIGTSSGGTSTGAPKLVIEAAETDPLLVGPGSAFTLTLRLVNRGNRQANNVLVGVGGSQVIPAEGSSVMAVPPLRVGQTATVTLPLVMGEVERGGRIGLPISLQYSDYSGSNYTDQPSIGLDVDASLTRRPQLLISSYVAQPSTLSPGDRFTLTLTLSNPGSRPATGVVVGVSGSLAVPAEGSNVAFVNSVGVGEMAEVVLPLVLGDVDKGGRQNLGISLQYGDPGGGKYTDQQNIGLEVNTGMAHRPQLLIAGYAIDPPRLAAGDRFTLTLTLTNVGGGDAQRLLVSLGVEGSERLEAFVPAGSSNVNFVPALAAGQSIDIVQRLIVDAKADPKAYNVPLGLVYDDARGNRKTETQRISLMVLRRPEFRVDFYRPVEMAMAGMPFPLPVEVFNTGLARMNVPLVEVMSSEQVMIEQGSTFVGNLEPSASWTLDAMVTVMQPGPAEIEVRIHYLDDFNQRQMITRTLTVQVMEGSGFEPGDPDIVIPDQPETFWHKVLRFLRGLVGLGS